MKPKEAKMKVFLATILAAAIATPAAAQYYSSPNVLGYDWLGRPIVTETQIVTVKRLRRGAGAYAQDPGMMRNSAISANDVYVNGVYVGSDPDPRIRETLRREYLSESSIH
jgi:hypothetical protein